MGHYLLQQKLIHKSILLISITEKKNFFLNFMIQKLLETLNSNIEIYFSI
jgi:hypothetical protein